MLQGLFQLYQMKKKTPRRLGEATQICALEMANQRQENTKLGLGGAATEPEHKVEGALLLDVVVGEGPAVLQLLAGEDEPLLVRGDALLVLDLGLDVLDGVRRLHLEGDGLAGQGLHEDLHPSAEPEHEVEGALLLDVVVGEGSAVLQLLAGEDEPLLVRGDALLVLDLGFDILYGVRGLHLE